MSFSVSVFCSLPWRAPATAACWKDTTSTLIMWNILWRACGKMACHRNNTHSHIPMPKLEMSVFYLMHYTFCFSTLFSVCVCRREGIDVRVVKRGEYNEEVVRWADAIISAGGKHLDHVVSLSLSWCHTFLMQINHEMSAWKWKCCW